MGQCLCCFEERGDAGDPILNAEARRRAAEAAQARQQAHIEDPVAKRLRLAAERERAQASGGNTGKPDLADARTWD